METSRICALIGPAGTGKSTMIALTAPKQPVHFLDIDRKIAAQANLQPAIEKGQLTWWELQETLAEESLEQRVKDVAADKKPQRSPKGWLSFASQVDKLSKDPVAMAAGSWALDSYTRLCEHLKRLILHYDDKALSNLSPRNWGAYLAMNEETMTTLIDTAKLHGKDLFITVHEVVRDAPNEATKVRHEKDRQGNMQRVFEGSMDMRIQPSVEGQFAAKMFTYFHEVYQLRVDMVQGKPKWVCRVKPDGLRDLRTSFNVTKDEFDPDFRQIWGGR